MRKENSINQEIQNYIIEASLSNSDSVKSDTLIFDTGLLDSLGLLFLIEFISEKYEVEVNDEELNPKNFESINRIESFINEKLKTKAA